MGKIDKAKEYIGAIKVYMGFILASIMGSTTGTVKMYLAGETQVMFWIGVTGVVLLSFVFMLLAKHLHNKIDKLEEL